VTHGTHSVGREQFHVERAIDSDASRAAAREEAACGNHRFEFPAIGQAVAGLEFAGLDREVFAGIFLDARNRLLAFEVLSTGTLTQASVYPREVVKVALARNAAAVMFVHNHPSGCAEPSRADELLTQSLKQALSTVDIKVLDHFIVGGSAVLSFAERGLI